MADAPESPVPPIGWARAALTALAIVLAGIAVLVFGVNALLTHLSGLDRSQRVGIATVGFFTGLILLAWLLRRLQQRHLI
jgi:hypothetical protein